MNSKLKKYNSIFMLVILLGVNNLFAQQGWYNLNVSFGGVGIYFKDINTGIVAAHKTTNAGNTWNYIGFGAHMSFPDLNTGYAVGGGDIQKTTNFGDNWVMQINPSGQFLNSIYCPTVNTGYACGESGTLIKTTNGGGNWLIVEPIAAPLSTLYIFTNVSFADALTGYIAGYKNAIDTSIFIKTTNGGINWTVQKYIVSNWGRFTSMFFINASTGFIGSVGASGYILKTTNGGGSWNQTILPTANRINSLYFPSASTGYGACYGGQILKTTNGGSNWFLQTTGTGSILYSIFFLNDLTGYTSGDNNTILKTTDGGGPPIGITPISNEVPKDFSLGQNYPNPFNPVTNIRFSLPKAGLVNLTIYDAMGRVIEVLFNGALTSGTYKADWNAANYPSGIYFYRLYAGDYIETKKMILIK